MLPKFDLPITTTVLMYDLYEMEGFTRCSPARFCRQSHRSAELRAS